MRVIEYFQIILEVTTDALVNEKQGKASTYNRLILGMIGSDTLNFEGLSVYDVLLRACSLVASLSDGAAVHMHNKITGKQL